MTNILIVEDEQNLARFIELELTHENYTVDIENDGKVGLDKALSKPYDLYIRLNASKHKWSRNL